MTELFIKNTISEIMFGGRICESLEDRWIVNYLYEELLLEKLLYGEPITVPELRSLLRQKILNFEFIKLDGEVRPAKGTTMMKYIPTEQHPQGIRPSSPKVATFYDLQKMDWRSVSQRSREIVLKKDEETGKPIVMVKDKPEDGEIAVDTKYKEPEVPVTEPEVIEPDATIDDIPVDTDFDKKPEVTVDKVKPIERTEKTKTFYFINPKTGASKETELTAKDVVKELKKMGPGWMLADEDEYGDSEKIIQAASEEEPDELKVGDRRNYLNNRGENVEIMITGTDDYGGYYAKTQRGGMFKIPQRKMQFIGEPIKGEGFKTKSEGNSIITKLDKKVDLENIPADEV